MLHCVCKSLHSTQFLSAYCDDYREIASRFINRHGYIRVTEISSSFSGSQGQSVETEIVCGAALRLDSQNGNIPRLSRDIHASS